MSAFLEIMLYIVIAFGIMLITMAILEKEIIKNSYVIEKDKLKIKIVVDMKDATDEEKNVIKKVIEKGEYDSIYDLTDEVIIK